MKIVHPWDTFGPSYFEIKANAVLLDSKGHFVAQKAAIPFASVKDKFQPLPLTWTWGTATDLSLTVKVAYELLAKGTGISFADAYGKGSFSFAANWKFYYEESGLVVHPETPLDLGGKWDKDFGVAVAVTQDQAAAQATQKTAKLVLHARAGYAKDGIEIGISWTGKGGQGGGGISTTVGGTTKGYSKDFPLTVQCDVVGKPVKAIVLPDHLLLHKVYFPFKKWEPRGGQLTALDGWIKELRDEAPALLAALRDGTCPISLAGYASEPGSDKDNIDYAGARIKVVRDELDNPDRLGGKVRILGVENHGDRNANRKGESEAMQRVEIFIKDGDAKKAMRTGAKTR